MTKLPPADRGHGCLLALCLMLGPVVGWFFGQPTLGMVAGLVIGLLVVLLASRLDR